MSNNTRLYHNPLDVELVKEITPKDFQEWITQKLGGIDSLPQHIVDYLSNPEAHLAPLLDVMTPGDTLCLCRSQKIGPLYGHEGVALVRDGRPILYLRAVDY